MKFAVSACTVVMGAAFCLATLADADQPVGEPADNRAPVAVSALSEAMDLPGMPAGENPQWVLITAKDLIGPRPFKPNQGWSREFEEAAQQGLKVGEHHVVLFASQVFAAKKGLNTEIAARDCTYVISAGRASVRGKASRVRFVTGNPVVYLEDALIAVGLSVVGPDLDNAAVISAKLLELDFEACKLDTPNAEVHLDL